MTTTTTPPEGTQLCLATRRDGLPCRTRALPNDRFCFAHSQRTAGKRQAACHNGGVARSNAARAAAAQAAQPGDLRGVLAVLLDALPATRDEVMKPATAAAISSLAGAIVKLWQLSEVDARVAALEQRLNGGRTDGRA